MVMAPGGEVQRPEYEPSQCSVGIRLTKRNRAIEEIQKLRGELCRFETPEVIGEGKRTTRWTSCFGARKYQPHITLLGPSSGIDPDFTILGISFRSEIEWIDFGRFEVICPSTY